MTSITETQSVAVTWRCAEMGLWIATALDGRPVGIVSERWGNGFVVTACTGRDLGTHRTLAEAQTALEASLTSEE